MIICYKKVNEKYLYVYDSLNILSVFVPEDDDMLDLLDFKGNRIVFEGGNYFKRVVNISGSAISFSEAYNIVLDLLYKYKDYGFILRNISSEGEREFSFGGEFGARYFKSNNLFEISSIQSINVIKKFIINYIKKNCTSSGSIVVYWLDVKVSGSYYYFYITAVPFMFLFNYFYSSLPYLCFCNYSRFSDIKRILGG